MAVTTSWSMSWCHYSTAEGDALNEGGLLRSWRAASNVASTPAATDDAAAVLAIR
jgi:hypothetical protein